MAKNKWRDSKFILHVALPKDVEKFVKNRRKELGNITKTQYIKQLLLDDGCDSKAIIGLPQ